MREPFVMMAGVEFAIIFRLNKSPAEVVTDDVTLFVVLAPDTVVVRAVSAELSRKVTLRLVAPPGAVPSKT